jgi:hypothetical protein
MANEVNTITREQVIEILNDMGRGKTIKQICYRAGIDTKLVWDMIHSEASLMDLYNSKKVLQIFIMSDELIDLIEMPTPMDDNGKPSSVIVNLRKVQIDSKKWILSKLMANVYGEGSKETEQDIQIDV